MYSSNWFKIELFELDVMWTDDTYRQTSTVSRTLLGNKIVDHSDVVGAPVVSFWRVVYGQ